MAPIYRTQRAGVALDQVLGRGGFDLARIEALEPGFLAPGKHDVEPHVHDEDCGHAHGDDAHASPASHAPAADHVHDDDIASVSLRSHVSMDGAAVSRWLEALVADQGPQILRLKGIFDLQGEARKLVVQGVHMLLEGELQQPWGQQEPRSSRLVLIGRRLDRVALQAGFEGCVAAA